MCTALQYSNGQPQKSPNQCPANASLRRTNSTTAQIALIQKSFIESNAVKPPFCCRRRVDGRRLRWLHRTHRLHPGPADIHSHMSKRYLNKHFTFKKKKSCMLCTNQTAATVNAGLLQEQRHSNTQKIHNI